jgi:hypothetical protein
MFKLLADYADRDLGYVVRGETVVGKIWPDSTEDSPQPFMIMMRGKIIRESNGDRMHFKSIRDAFNWVDANYA